jgi:hypothetical protein
LYVPDVTVLHKFSPDKRIHWRTGRYRRWLKNRLYIEAKYSASTPRILLMAGAYLLKGLINGVPFQTIRGLIESAAMVRTFRAKSTPLRPDARAEAYITAHERRFEPSLWLRLRTDVIARLED